MKGDGVPQPDVSAYANGVWSAEPASTGLESTDYTVNGSVIYLSYDWGVLFPLWDAVVLLPEDRVWLRESLGLSKGLVDDLFGWCREMGSAIGSADLADPPGEGPLSVQSDSAVAPLNVRGEELARQLEQELGSRFNVEFRPW